ncbi:MAG: hypothetical protein JKY17_00400, partial [Magnetovibrio sp.]|nr:hypothetical protein [Magnetovibrio sp.]
MVNFNIHNACRGVVLAVTLVLVTGCQNVVNFPGLNTAASAPAPSPMFESVPGEASPSTTVEVARAYPPRPRLQTGMTPP